MTTSAVCPWCQTEIVWDEELGPEEVCPYCENELGDYRTIDVELEQNEDEAEDEAYDENVVGTPEESECAFCHETTVKVGVHKVDQERFIPTMWSDDKQPLLQTPFTMDVYLCLACSQVQFILSDESRKQVEKRMKNSNFDLD